MKLKHFSIDIDGKKVTYRIGDLVGGYKRSFHFITDIEVNGDESPVLTLDRAFNHKFQPCYSYISKCKCRKTYPVSSEMLKTELSDIHERYMYVINGLENLENNR